MLSRAMLGHRKVQACGKHAANKLYELLPLQCCLPCRMPQTGRPSDHGKAKDCQGPALCDENGPQPAQRWPGAWVCAFFAAGRAAADGVAEVLSTGPRCFRVKGCHESWKDGTELAVQLTVL